MEPIATDSRYSRQLAVLPESARKASALLVIGAESNPIGGTVLTAGAAGMGIALGSDFGGPARQGDHWLLGSYPVMVETINPGLAYTYLDPEFLRDDIPDAVAGRTNAWAAVWLNDPAMAQSALDDLAGANVPIGVLLALAGPGGAMVARCPNVEEAREWARRMPSDLVLPGEPETAVIAAGLILNEVLYSAGGRQRGAEQTAETLYSLRRPRRVTGGTGGVEELVRELSAGPPGGRRPFAGIGVYMVGAGALGNWAGIALALDGGVRMRVFDGDPQVEAHNVNRQILLARGVGAAPKAEVLVSELRRLDPAGTYESDIRFVHTASDLPGLAEADLLACVPDRDPVRLTCADACRTEGKLFGTGGSSATGGQAVVVQPGRACYRCVTGQGDADPGDHSGQSCALVAGDAVVSSNMVAAGLMVSELREALSGRATANVRFVGEGPGGWSRLVRMISNPPCRHGAA